MEPPNSPRNYEQVANVTAPLAQPPGHKDQTSHGELPYLGSHYLEDDQECMQFSSTSLGTFDNHSPTVFLCKRQLFSGCLREICAGMIDGWARIDPHTHRQLVTT